MSAWNQLVHSLSHKKITVLGMGVSNTPLITLLLEQHIPVTVRDKNPDTSLQLHFEALGATFITGEDYLEHLTEDVIFRTPGLSPNTPQLKKARDGGAKITSEMQEFFNLCPCPIIAVTGSDGKTTTTTLIAEFLKATGKPVFLGGNIGTPLLCDVDAMTEDSFAVVELSSFQLMDLTCDPTVAVVTNISPNHLDYHGTMEEYSMAKTNIFTKQSPSHKVIFNADNMESIALLGLKKGIARYFSRKKEESQVHCFLKNNEIILKTENETNIRLPLDSIHLKGVHNWENFMAAMLAVEDFCTEAQIQSVAKEFYGVEHRMEYLKTLHGVSYYNDSIGTSPSRTIAGLQSFDQRIILIAGGYDKKIPFDQLGAEIQGSVKHLILMGDTATSIEHAVQLESSKKSSRTLEGELRSITLCHNLTDAVETAYKLAIEGDCVVLSPACAAFDQFKNFVERGTLFKQLVASLP